jgi:hypothetical protein
MGNIARQIRTVLRVAPLAMVMAAAPFAFHEQTLHAQAAPRVEPLITQPVNEHSLVSLSGNTPARLQAAIDRGPAQRSMRTDRLVLVLRRNEQQKAALQSFLRSVQDPSSPQFHQWVTPEKFGSLYGPADADLNTVQSWLRHHGLTVTRVSTGRTTLEFSGTVAQVENAFHTSIHSYEIGGTQHWANASDPMIPTALAPVVAGVASLHDFKPRAQAVRGPAAQWSSTHRRFQPQRTSTFSGGPYLFVTPGDAAAIYNTPTTLNPHLAAGQSPLDGTGVTIGVVEDSLPDLLNLRNYQASFGLPVPTYGASLVLDGDPSSIDPTADATEALLDLEVAQALAPGAHLIMYTAGDTTYQPGVFLAAFRAIDDNAVDILSVSFGACEQDLGSAGNLEILNAWEQAAAQGITITVSSGDAGSAGCDNPNTELLASRGLAVNGLSSTPYNIAVGGTDFNVLNSSFSAYVGSTNAADLHSVSGYIPEDSWNNSTTSAGLLVSSHAFTDAVGDTNIVAGGGGRSSAGNVSGATPAGYAKPVWQQGFAPSNTDAVRDLPDVSLFAGSGAHRAMWAICLEGDCQGTSPTVSGIGGTSAAAPAFAGMLALVSQKLGGSLRLGQADQVLYQLAQTAPIVFHTIAASNNAVPCTPGSADCGANGFLLGYNAAAGYNLATGLGSVDVTQLLNHWTNLSRASTTTSLTLDKTSFVHGTPVHIRVGVGPSGVTGNVAIVNNAATQPLASSSTAATLLPLVNGAASGAYSQFPGGTYTIYGSYPGDSSHAGSSSSGVEITVSPEDTTLQFSAGTIANNGQFVGLAGATVPLGTFTILRARPIGMSQSSAAAPATNATGTVFFEDAPSSSGRCQDMVSLDSTGTAEAHYASCSAGVHSLSAQYNGDLSYNPASSGTVTFTVLKGSTSISLNADVSTIAYGQLNLTASLGLSAVVPGLPPNRQVTFTDTSSNTVLGTAPLTTANCAAGACYIALLGIPASALSNGLNSITASYPGDDNYSPSSVSTPVAIRCTATCSNGTGQTLTLSYSPLSSSGVISPGTAITTSVSVLAGGGFTGPVNLTCSVTGLNGNDLHPPTCSFNPAQIHLSGNQGATAQLTIASTAAVSNNLGAHAVPPPQHDRWYAAGSTALACILLFGIPRQRRRFLNSYCIAALRILFCFATMSSLLACGGAGSAASPHTSSGTGAGVSAGGTTPDTYTVTVKAADAVTGTVTAAGSLTLTVQ